MSETRGYDLGSAILRGIEVAETLYAIRFFAFWLTSVGLLGFLDVEVVNSGGLLLVGLGFVLGFYQIYRREAMPKRRNQAIYIVSFWIFGLLWFTEIPMLIFPFAETTAGVYSVYAVALLLVIFASYALAYRRDAFRSLFSVSD